jgi:hypothetical protein
VFSTNDRLRFVVMLNTHNAWLAVPIHSVTWLEVSPWSLLTQVISLALSTMYLKSSSHDWLAFKLEEPSMSSQPLCQIADEYSWVPDLFLPPFFCDCWLTLPSSDVHSVLTPAYLPSQLLSLPVHTVQFLPPTEVLLSNLAFSSTGLTLHNTDLDSKYKLQWLQ